MGKITGSRWTAEHQDETDLDLIDRNCRTLTLFRYLIERYGTPEQPSRHVTRCARLPCCQQLLGHVFSSTTTTAI